MLRRPTRWYVMSLSVALVASCGVTPSLAVGPRGLYGDLGAPLMAPSLDAARTDGMGGLSISLPGPSLDWWQWTGNPAAIAIGPAVLDGEATYRADEWKLTTASSSFTRTTIGSPAPVEGLPFNASLGAPSLGPLGAAYFGNVGEAITNGWARSREPGGGLLAMGRWLNGGERARRGIGMGPIPAIGVQIRVEGGQSYGSAMPRVVYPGGGIGLGVATMPGFDIGASGDWTTLTARGVRIPGRDDVLTRGAYNFGIGYKPPFYPFFLGASLNLVNDKLALDDANAPLQLKSASVVDSSHVGNVTTLSQLSIGGGLQFAWIAPYADFGAQLSYAQGERWSALTALYSHMADFTGANVLGLTLQGAWHETWLPISFCGQIQSLLVDFTADERHALPLSKKVYGSVLVGFGYHEQGLVLGVEVGGAGFAKQVAGGSLDVNGSDGELIGRFGAEYTFLGTLTARAGVEMNHPTYSGAPMRLFPTFGVSTYLLHMMSFSVAYGASSWTEPSLLGVSNVTVDHQRLYVGVSAIY